MESFHGQVVLAICKFSDQSGHGQELLYSEFLLFVVADFPAVCASSIASSLNHRAVGTVASSFRIVRSQHLYEAVGMASSFEWSQQPISSGAPAAGSDGHCS